MFFVYLLTFMHGFALCTCFGTSCLLSGFFNFRLLQDSPALHRSGIDNLCLCLSISLDFCHKLLQCFRTRINHFQQHRIVSRNAAAFDNIPALAHIIQKFIPERSLHCNRDKSLNVIAHQRMVNTGVKPGNVPFPLQLIHPGGCCRRR